MKHPQALAIIIVASIFSGCEGLYLMTTTVEVEYTGESTSSVKSSNSSSEDGKTISTDDVNPDDMSTKEKTPQQHLRNQSLPPNLVLVDHFADASCPTRDTSAQSIAQLTGSWCWAASAEALIKFHDSRKGTVRKNSQCDIVNTVLNGGRPKAGEPLCCADMWNAVCQQNNLPGPALRAFGYEYKLWRKAKFGRMPENKIRGQVCDNGPFSFVLYFAEGGGHSFVVADYADIDDEISLWIHDHSYVLGDDNRRLATEFELWSYDAYVNGKWHGETHEHAFDYVLIR
jgi:hypothetical protein